jgi:hypothetical protein
VYSGLTTLCCASIADAGGQPLWTSIEWAQSLRHQSAQANFSDMHTILAAVRQSMWLAGLVVVAEDGLPQWLGDGLHMVDEARQGCSGTSGNRKAVESVEYISAMISFFLETVDRCGSPNAGQK